MKVLIISPVETKITEKVNKITISTQKNQIQILKNHAEMFLEVEKGKIYLSGVENEKEVEVENAEIYVKDNIIKIIL